MTRTVPGAAAYDIYIDTRIVGAALRKEAETVFGTDRVLHLYPPNSLRADARAYFERLSSQCRLGKCQESRQWAGALEERVNKGELFPLITGFENGPEEPRTDTAGELRGFVDRFASFHLIVVGGERPAALKYGKGTLSFFNIAVDIPVPEPSTAEMEETVKTICPDWRPTKEQLDELAAFTGGHPLLLRHCVEQRVTTKDACERALGASPIPGGLFSKFREERDKENLRAYLRQQDLGRFELRPDDELVRRLYWRNLITGRDGRLCWRCEYIRKIGMEIVG